jgi:lysophospholipase L1-like esterase
VATSVIPPLGRSAAAARTNNPRTLAAMTTPPVISDNAAPLGSLTNIYSALSPATAGVLNQYGGVPTDDTFGYNKYPCVTFSGALVPFVSRIEVMADAAIVEFKVFNSGPGVCRFIVDGQYVSKSLTTPVASSVRYLRLDFTAAGGRARRLITMELHKFIDFQYVAVGATSTVTKPPAKPLRMYVIGDSYTQGGGATFDFNGYHCILGDLLGIKDVWSGGVGGTGFLANSGASQLTFRQRISDLVTAAPDVILIVGGFNDTGVIQGALSAEVRTYLAAIRSYPTLSSVPVIMTLNNGNLSVATAQQIEGAMSSAMQSFGDPLMFFLPNTLNNPSGALFTGTGNTAAPAGNGNCDVYIGTDSIHPNDLGHAYMAGWFADNITRLVLA